MCKVMQKWNISLISIVLAQVKTYAALNAGAEEAHWPTTVGMFTLGSAARGSKKRESEMRGGRRALAIVSREIFWDFTGRG